MSCPARRYDYCRHTRLPSHRAACSHATVGADEPKRAPSRNPDQHPTSSYLDSTNQTIASLQPNKNALQRTRYSYHTYSFHNIFQLFYFMVNDMCLYNSTCQTVLLNTTNFFNTSSTTTRNEVPVVSARLMIPVLLHYI